MTVHLSQAGECLLSLESRWGREAVGEQEEVRHLPGMGAEEVDAKSSLLSS